MNLIPNAVMNLMEIVMLFPKMENLKVFWQKNMKFFKLFLLNKEFYIF